jgi:hypothetical protein
VNPPTDRASLAELVDAALDGGGRQHHAAGDAVVGAAAVPDQQREDRSVNRAI